MLACDRGLHVLPRLAPLRVSGMVGRGVGGTIEPAVCFANTNATPPPSPDPRP